MQSSVLSRNRPLSAVLKVAALTGAVSALLGALLAWRVERGDAQLDPEHPLFGR